MPRMEFAQEPVGGAWPFCLTPCWQVGNFPRSLSMGGPALQTRLLWPHGQICLFAEYVYSDSGNFPLKPKCHGWLIAILADISDSTLFYTLCYLDWTNAILLVLLSTPILEVPAGCPAKMSCISMAVLCNSTLKSEEGEFVAIPVTGVVVSPGRQFALQRGPFSHSPCLCFWQLCHFPPATNQVPKLHTPTLTGYTLGIFLAPPARFLLANSEYSLKGFCL